MNKELEVILNEHDHIVFFGGAGVSTESGIPDFRSADGLYSRKEYQYPPETMLSRSFFDSHTEMFFKFYQEVMLAEHKGPSCVHKKLAEMEKAKKLDAIVTQNIDGLHQLAGSEKVYELHGSVLRNYCMKCGASYSAETIQKAKGIPRCPKDNGIIKPDVVLYEESLKMPVIEGAVNAIRNADVLIIAGTSLVVYPAAGLIDYFNGSKLVIINRDPTPRDKMADLLINTSISEAFC